MHNVPQSRPQTDQTRAMAAKTSHETEGDDQSRSMTATSVRY